MTVPPLDLRQDVAEVLVRYAAAIDRRDWVLFRSCFTDDCVADYGEIGVWHGVDAVTAWMAQSHASCGDTLHRITNVVTTASVVGVSARCYVDAIVMGPDNRTGTRAVGYYDDQLVDSDEGWKIARRRFTLVLLQTGLDAASR